MISNWSPAVVPSWISPGRQEVESFFADEQIDQVYLAAARVGGIKANNEQPADFIRENLQIQTNVIHAAHQAGVSRLLFLGSSCIYPRLAAQPMAEDALMTGPLESTNDAYAVAKIAGIKMCEAYRRQFGGDFRSAMPTNLYGPDDNFDLDSSHVLPALMRKFHQAVIEWCRHGYRVGQLEIRDGSSFMSMTWPRPVVF